MSDVSALSSSYFRLVKNILIKAKGAHNSRGSRIRQQGGLLDEAKQCDIEANLLSGPDTLMEVFVDSAMQMNSANLNADLSQNGRSLTHAFNELMGHLRICEDEASALELIDILSILSSNQAGLLNRTLEACWRVLHTVYADKGQVAIQFHDDGPPHAFIEAIARANAESQCPLNKRHLVERALSATMVRTATSTAKNVKENAMLRRSMLVLWGIMAQTSSSTSVHGFDYLSKLVDELERFLVGITDTALSSCENYDEDSEGQEDGRSRRRKTRSKRNRPYVSSMPSLTVASFDVFFELVLHMAVGIFSVSPHTRTSEAPRREGRGNGQDPFQHLHEIVKLVNRLFDVYISQFCIIPRRMVSIVLGSCKQMLTICVFHVAGCVQWRNVQPLLTAEEKRAGKNDYASIRFLEQLLQSFATCGPGKVISLCQAVSSLSAPSRATDGDSEEEHYMSNDKRFTNLMLAAQKTMEKLRSVASTHNIVPPRVEINSVEEASQMQLKNSLPLDDADKGYHQLEWNETVQDEFGSDKEGGKDTKRRRVTPTLVSVQTGRFDGEEETCIAPRKRRHPPAIDDEYEYEWSHNEGSSVSDDDLSHAPSDSFGASGHWGDDKVDEMSSSESLELEVSDIFQAS